MGIDKLEQNQADNQYLFFEKYQENNLIKIRNDLKNHFESVDQEIFFSSWRKNKGYIPDGFKSRTIRTIYGPVTFKRRVYKYWNKTRFQYVFLADQKLQIDKYSRIASHLKFKILEQVATGKRQRDICDMFTDANLTRATISNIIKLSDFPDSFKEISKNIVRIKIPKYLYINMDETFIKLRRNNKMKKYRIRLVTFHTGYHEFYSTEKRKVLANKRVYYQLLPINKKINTFEFMLTLEKVAKKFYSNVNQAKVIIGGDGAAWIRDAANYWINAQYVLDKFHAVRYLKQLYPNHHEEKIYLKYQKSKNLLASGAAKELLNELREIKSKPEKEQKLEKIVNFFKNNYFGVANQSLSWNIGVSAEGDVSHIIKWLLGYGSKAFNFQTFQNILFLKVNEVNQVDVVTFLQKQYQLEKEAIKNFYWKSYWATRENVRY